MIIPVYNGEETVARAIDSVLGQSYPAREIVVVDDGSTDNTASVVGGYGTAVRYLKTENRGVAAARNAGAAIATSGWLAFLDADDWYYPQRLEWHAALIESDPDLDFATGDFEYRDVEGRLLGRSMEATDLGRKLLETAHGGDAVMTEGMLGEFVAKHFGDTHTLTVPRQSFAALGGYPTKYQVCEDVHLLIRLCASSKRVGVVCRPMAVYWIHGESATRRNPIRAQRQTVAALGAVRRSVADAPTGLKRGVDRALRAGRRDLAYALLRTGRRAAAVRAVLPLLGTRPLLGAVRDVLSVARGFRSAEGEDGSR
ncbi:MAG: glycosyltransferase [Gammaproteobacteria bacterium]